MAGEVFLTGATGFIGARLLRKWLDSTDANVTVLARARREDSARNRIGRILAADGGEEKSAPYAGRVEVAEGDLAAENLGLSQADYDKLAGKISHIIHCGAAARFDLELEDARKTNVGGTKGVLGLARACRNLEKLDYIGTAYVAGKRSGIILESELDVGQGHNNTYERSKLEAETLIREAMAELPISIFRPTIVVCDSRTGHVSPHGGFARILRAYSAGELVMLPGSPSCRLDLIPLDYTIDAIFTISADETSAGGCYHLSAGLDRATTLQEISELADRHLGKGRFAIIPPEQFQDFLSKQGEKLPADAMERLGELNIYLPYLTADLWFDNANTLAALRGTGVEVPRFESYFGRMAEHLKNAQ